MLRTSLTGNLRYLFIVILLSVSLFCFAQSNTSTGEVSKPVPHGPHVPDSSLQAFHSLSFYDAKKILAQPPYLNDSIWEFNGGIWKYKCVYVGNFKDSITQQKPRMYFGFEHYKKTVDAKIFYDLIKKENAKTSSVISLDQLGDEAFLTKDALNGPFIMIRKDKKIFKLRLYNITSDSSVNELQVFAKKLIL